MPQKKAASAVLSSAGVYWPCFDGDVQFSAKFEDGGAGDAGQDIAGSGGIELAFHFEEHVGAGTFGDITVHIREQGFVESFSFCLMAGHDGVDVVAGGFCFYFEPFRVGALKRGGHDPQQFFTEEGRHLPGLDDGKGFGVGVKAHVCGTINDWADIGVLEVVLFQYLIGGADHFGSRIVVGHVEGFGGALEPVEVLDGLEDLCRTGGGAIRADAFEYGVAVVEGLAVEVGLCLRGFEDLAVQPENCVVRYNSLP